MHHRLLSALAIALVISISTATLAGAASGSRRPFKASAMLATFSPRHGYPGPGGTAVLSGPPAYTAASASPAALRLPPASSPTTPREPSRASQSVMHTLFGLGT